MGYEAATFVGDKRVFSEEIGVQVLFREVGSKKVFGKLFKGENCHKEADAFIAPKIVGIKDEEYMKLPKNEREKFTNRIVHSARPGTEAEKLWVPNTVWNWHSISPLGHEPLFQFTPV
jgi:hypothetical protein